VVSGVQLGHLGPRGCDEFFVGVGVASPNLGSGRNALYSVAAISANSAWAVGFYDAAAEQTLIEHWDGTSWSVQPRPDVGTGDNALLGVAATFAPLSTRVWAVGFSSIGTTYRTLVEHCC
jgi:hypothetical protein